MKTNFRHTLWRAAAGLLISAASVWAHCDTVEGPVVQDAIKALNSGDVTPVLKWVNAEGEKEVREVFAKSVKARAANGEAREVADRYFYEVLVRVHRAGEGEGFTGLKPKGTVAAGIAEAETAIKKESADVLAEQIATRLAGGIRERFKKVLAAKKHADDSVAAGRAYVKAYVEYIHYVERLHELGTQVSSDHHHTHAASAPRHNE